MRHEFRTSSNDEAALLDSGVALLEHRGEFVVVATNFSERQNRTAAAEGERHRDRHSRGHEIDRIDEFAIVWRAQVHLIEREKRPLYVHRNWRLLGWKNQRVDDVMMSSKVHALPEIWLVYQFQLRRPSEREGGICFKPDGPRSIAARGT